MGKDVAWLEGADDKTTTDHDQGPAVRLRDPPRAL